MQYFEGINFLRWAVYPACSAWVDKTFDGYYTIQLNDSGRMHMRLGDGADRVLHGPFVWLTYPGVRFRYGNRDGAVWSHRFVAFNGSRVEQYISKGLFPLEFDNLDNPGTPVIPLADPARLRRAFDELLDCLNSLPLNMSVAVHLLEGLLLLLHEPDSAADNLVVIDRFVADLAQAVARTPDREWDFVKESRHANVSYHHLRRIFKRRLGLAPRQYVIKCRLKRAAGMLCHTVLPVKIIAEQVGVPDVYYFSKIFRAHYKLAPGRYRREFGQTEYRQSEK